MTPSFQPGERLGDLVIEREIGHGAFAVVYLARDTVLGRPVALKVLSVGKVSDSAEDRGRLLQEARLVARLHSPRIVTLHRVHDLGAAGLALEMEFMDGGSLDDLLRSRVRLAPPEATAHLASLLEALETAHGQGVVHRDVKPANLLFSARGDLKLADFGLGRQLGEASLSGGQGRSVQGTPLYMSPEVVGGEKATPASDLWSAGVVLYRMLSGRMPFHPGNLPALFYAIHHDPPEPLGPEHPPHLVRLVARCLEKDPAKRPESARALRRELLAAAAGPRTTEAAVEGRAARPAPLGREAELGMLDAALGRAEGGAGGAVLLLGEVGCGKSTLLEETTRRARARGSRVLDVAFTPLGGLQRPLLEAVRRLFTGESQGGSWTSQVTALRFGPASALLRGLLVEDAFEVQNRQQLVWAVEHLLRGLASERPVVLAIEDLHLGDGEDLRSIGEIVRRLGDAKALLLASYRTFDPASSEGLSPAAPALSELATTPGLSTLAVGPLDDATLAALVMRETGVERIAPEVRERVRLQSEGNALYAIELVRHLLSEGAVEVRTGRLERAPRWNDAALPSRLSELVSVRLQRLTEEQRGLLDAAAVDGVVFDAGAVAAVLGLNHLHVLRSLQHLTRDLALITAQRQGYRFAHHLFRDVIYRELAPDLSRHLHRALAEHLEAQGVARSDPERLGTHWEQAGEAARARPLLQRAALHAARRQEYTRALDLAERGGAHLVGPVGRPDALEGDLLLAVTGVLSDVGRGSDAEGLVARIREAASSTGDETLRLRALVWKNDLAHFARGVEATSDAELEEAAGQLGPGYECGRAHWLLGYAAHTRGHLDDAERHVRRADEIYTSTGAVHGHAQALHVLGDIDLSRGLAEGAVQHFLQSARAMEALGRRADAAISRIMSSVAAFQAGRLEGARHALESGIRELETTGSEARAAHASVLLAKVEVAEGAYESALSILARAMRTLGARELIYGRLDALQEIVHVLLLLDRPAEARVHLEEGQRLARQAHYADCLAVLDALGVKQLLLSGDPAAAHTRAREGATWLDSKVSRAGVAEAALILATCGLYGLPADAGWEAVEARLAGPDGDPVHRAARALLDGRRALQAQDGPSSALLEVAERLRASGVAVNRAEVLLLADCLEAEGRHRRGEPETAAALRKRVREQAARLPNPALARLAS